MYSVKAVSKATGISCETLRAWERRYGAVKPVREANGRRCYNHDDVARLRTLRRLSDLGHSISRIASLSAAQLDELCRQADQQSAFSGGPELVCQLLNAAANYDEDACDEALAQAVCVLRPDRLISDVLSPALVEVGRQWHLGLMSISQEHLLSTRIRRLVLSLLNAYRTHSNAPSIVFSTQSGEDHSFGSLFAALLAASLGMRATYIDHHLPPEELDSLVRNTAADALALSLVCNLQKEDSRRQLTELVQLSRGDYPVWVGGACAAELDSEGSLPNGCEFLRNIGELEARLSLPVCN